ncbi:MAG: pilus assembly FimT family protein, partial [bacterium]
MGRAKFIKGFSLVELLIVISIFVVLLFLSAPLFFPENIKFDSWA